MQGVAEAIRFHGNRLKLAVLQHISMKDKYLWSNLFTRFESAISTPTLPHRGLENTTIAQLLKAKGEDEAGAVYWCNTTDTVYDAVKNMTQHNIGALVVVKPGDEKLLAGIITERDYLNKIIVQGRSSKATRVGEIMTEENKLIAVSSDANILQAMQLMTDKHIRHVPVIDHKVVGMISIVDVVRAVLEQQHQEVKRLNEFIRGDYY
ncbi:CBS domain-containing protein CBSX3, mitochondrial-like [Phoenix dactylifera]|uniref:CBS domain-containing protein CBSX3, mitochondrial-like n=1 Tax=Phoenix dactylifera TaxID=42345 RepID=A0A8B9A4H3_PHODC|nr:CBS domain-containing protein CBSX3, mitochondrial-like [Phoenix dactylifera]XP_017701894.1 CBS domain-containing protein CBSX3, mitochondrial-like [Phoenix dactylifera]XP_038981530.1 CBS domain-containing protein CBSX3, mitochondrial-like [Phoenix dactylifera]